MAPLHPRTIQERCERAFKEVAKVYHPDKNPPDKQGWAHEQMSRFNFIMETLLNPATRREYDDLVKKYEEAPPIIARLPRKSRLASANAAMPVFFPAAETARSEVRKSVRARKVVM